MGSFESRNPPPGNGVVESQYTCAGTERTGT